MEERCRFYPNCFPTHFISSGETRDGYQTWKVVCKADISDGCRGEHVDELSIHEPRRVRGIKGRDLFGRLITLD